MTMDKDRLDDQNDYVDYLEPRPLKQSTQADTSFALGALMSELLGAIRHELLKDHPEVLAETRVGTNNVLADQRPQGVSFLVGGQPTIVHKILMWNQTGKAVRVSISGMSDADEGFSLTGTLIQLDIPIGGLSIALDEAGTIGVNRPDSTSADGTIFIYGFTIPTHEKA